MKFSKSFTIFVFVLSVSSTFSWTMRKTKGDLLKSLQFSMYYLSIKFNLIGPNLVMHHQENQQLLTSARVTRVLPSYNRHSSALDDPYYGRSKVYMGKMESYVSYRSESVF